MKNFGLIIKEVEEGAYILGGTGSLGGEILQPLGDWTSYLPPDELQAQYGFDPQDCVTQATLNSIETLIARKNMEHRQYSKRFLAKISNTTPQGNDPHVVAEALRTKGCAFEGDYPITPDATTWDIFYQNINDVLYALATQFTEEFSLGHEYVPLNETSIKQALQYSPLAVGVFAWAKDENGLYVRPNGFPANHCVELYGYEEGKFWKIFDSYDSTHKKLAWNFTFAVAKRFTLDRAIPNPLYALLLKFLSIVWNQPMPPVVEPTIPSTTPIPECPTDKLAEAALVMIGRDPTPTDVIPDEVACVESLVAVLPLEFGISRSLTYTPVLFQALKANPRFKATLTPSRGCIIVSPTAGGQHGHCGIFVTDTDIASNDSRTGLWTQNYTFSSWVKDFKLGKRLHTYIFEPV